MSAVEPSDEDLVLMHRSGVPGAAAVLWERHQRLAYRLAFSRLQRVPGPRAQLAEEVRQGAFLRALQSFAPGRGTFVALLVTTVRNGARDAARRESKHPASGLAENEDLAGRLVDLDDLASSRRLLELFKAALDRLPGDQQELLRRALQHADAEGGDHDDGPGSEALRSRYRRARAQLAREMIRLGALDLEEAVYDELLRTIARAT